MFNPKLEDIKKQKEKIEKDYEEFSSYKESIQGYVEQKNFDAINQLFEKYLDIGYKFKMSTYIVLQITYNDRDKIPNWDKLNEKMREY